MAVFFIVFFALYALINYYIGLRAWQALEAYPYLRPWFLVIFIFMAASYITAKVLQKSIPDLLYMLLEITGSFWFAFMFYFFLAILLVDLARLFNFNIPDYLHLKSWILITVLVSVMVIIAAGFYNTRNVIVRDVNVKIKSKNGTKEIINAVLISDIHLSTINNDRFARMITNKINSLNPDIILFGGDLVDDRASYLRRNGIGKSFKFLRAKYGIYGITGNHEYINGIEGCISYMEELNIKVLRDSMVNVSDKFILAGREDRAKSQFGDGKRKELGEILGNTDHLPVILLDHTPFGLEDAVNNNVDLQLSGHTHHGQLFPINYITFAIYEASQGYLKKENTQFYVSSGVGTWGPPVRLGSRSEIVNIRIEITPQ